MAAADGDSRCQESVPEISAQSGAIAETPAEKPDHSQALAEIFRNHKAALVRFLTVRTGSVEDAKEIVQESFAKMLALDHPGTIGFLAGYLWRIAVNLAIDRRRQQAQHEGFTRATASSASKQEASAESTADARERLAIVERAIGNLPARCLEAFILHVIRGLTFDEVGCQMGISARMAKKHVARALEYLQTCLDEAGTRDTR